MNPGASLMLSPGWGFESYKATKNHEFWIKNWSWCHIIYPAATERIKTSENIKKRLKYCVELFAKLLQDSVVAAIFQSLSELLSFSSADYKGGPCNLFCWSKNVELSIVCWSVGCSTSTMDFQLSINICTTTAEEIQEIGAKQSF